MLWGASRFTVFDDEAFSCRRYVLPLPDMLRALWQGDEPDPPLYYILQNASVRLFGVGPLALRGLSILFFLIGLVFLRKAGDAWFDETVGRWAMSLAAAHPAHWLFGFAARWYAAMFCAVALLAWVTGRMVRASQPQLDKPDETVATRRRPAFWHWSIAAAVVCYINYFGPVIAGLMWIVGLWATRHDRTSRRQWLAAALLAVVLYLPWAVPFWHEVTRFPQTSRSPYAYAATAGRTLMALLSGNLAAPSAWIVWTALGAFSVGLLILLAGLWRSVWPMTAVTLGAFFAGGASLTMIDKYILTFSGSACILLAALLVTGLRAPARSRTGMAARMCAATLAIGWAGCLVNLVTQRNWSSLRWLDPMETAVRTAVEKLEPAARAAAGTASFPDRSLQRGLILTHPSAVYYLGGMQARRPDARWKIDARQWAAAVLPQRAGGPMRYSAAAAIEKLSGPARPDRLVTVETAEFANDPDWASVRRLLSLHYDLDGEETFLEDPMAAFKDRVDPRFSHPKWRIIVRVWKRST
jgi:hypothetical protein